MISYYLIHKNDIINDLKKILDDKSLERFNMILKYILYNSKEIANKLSVSQSTIKIFTMNLRKKIKTKKLNKVTKDFLKMFFLILFGRRRLNNYKNFFKN